jgi:hypothetical protein
MSLLHHQSCECLKSELELFQVPPTQVCFESGYYVKYHPITSIDKGTPLEFRINTGDEDYIDPSSIILYTKSRILDAHRRPIIQKLHIPATAGGADAHDIHNDKAVVYPINYYHATRFSNVEVRLNNKVISENDNLYPYRAFFETLLSYGKNVKKTHLHMGLFYKDTNQTDDNFTDFEKEDWDEATINEGGHARWDLVKYSAPFECMGRIHTEICSQNKLIPSNSELKIKLFHTNTEFSLMSKKENVDYHVSVDTAYLMVKHQKVSSSIREAHMKALQKSNIKYPVRQLEMAFFTRGAGRQDLSENNLVNGVLPRRIILGLVKSEAFNGSYKHNPLKFFNYGMKTIEMKVSGKSLPFEKLEMDYGHDCHLQGYLSMIHGTGRLYSDSDIDISPYDEYAENYCIYVFDLSPDSADASHFELIREGTVSIEIKLDAATTESVTLICCMEYDIVIEIDKERNVSYKGE